MKVTTLRELKIWQRAQEFADAVSAILARPAFTRDRKLHDQLNESSVSIFSNVSEGFGQRTDRAFANHLSIARGSNNEAISQLAVAHTRGYISDSEYKELEQMSDRMGRMMTALIAYLDRCDRKPRS